MKVRTIRADQTEIRKVTEICQMLITQNFCLNTEHKMPTLTDSTPGTKYAYWPLLIQRKDVVWAEDCG